MCVPFFDVFSKKNEKKPPGPEQVSSFASHHGSLSFSKIRERERERERGSCVLLKKGHFAFQSPSTAITFCLSLSLSNIRYDYSCKFYGLSGIMTHDSWDGHSRKGERERESDLVLRECLSFPILTARASGYHLPYFFPYIYFLPIFSKFDERDNFKVNEMSDWPRWSNPVYFLLVFPPSFTCKMSLSFGMKKRKFHPILKLQ